MNPPRTNGETVAGPGGQGTGREARQESDPRASREIHRSSSTRAPLREDLRQIVLRRILSGELPAAELGVSRTPLREALFHLERDGFVRSDLARGFSVAPLSGREVREVYPILQSLESLALRSLGPVAAATAPELRRMNQELAEVAGDPEQGCAIDHRWHETLLSPCPNRRLIELIGPLRETVSRYERLYMRDRALVAASVAQHLLIVEALEAGDMDRAVRELEENWRFGLEMLLVSLGEP